ncbi:MAG: metalloregulator ArsR/SmtB family transcription factor [Dehalococcoidia bacterium]
MTPFGALADPTRIRILDLLCEGEQSVGELVRAFELSQPAVSQHLRVLKDAGLVASRPDAQRRLYRIRPERLRDLDRWLERYRKFWADELDALERHLDANP